MKILSIQLQPGRAPSMELSAARKALEDIGNLTDLVNKHYFEEGEDDGVYINYTFSTSNLNRLWEEIINRVYSGDLGVEIKKATIATCEGDDSWNDYLLLHHYDPSEPLDKL